MANFQASQSSSQSAAHPIKQGESLEIVKALLHGSLSCLTFLRSLFPEKCYEDQKFITSEKLRSYQNAIDGQESDDPVHDDNIISRTHSGTMLKSLRRGRSSRVDCFLDWLEMGVFPALGEGYLKGLQLSIFEDAGNPSNVVENYTFTFNYIQSPNRERTIDGVRLSLPYGPTVTIKTATYAMQMLVRRLISLCNTLPDLPESRYLSMHLFYTSKCPSYYEPFGFHKSLTDKIYFPLGCDWISKKQDCGFLDSGFHRTSLRVTHLEKMLLQNQSLQNDSNKITADELQYTSLACRQDDLDDFFQRIMYKLDEYICDKQSLMNQNYHSHDQGSRSLLEDLKVDFSGSGRKSASLQVETRFNSPSDLTPDVSCAKTSTSPGNTVNGLSDDGGSCLRSHNDHNNGAKSVNSLHLSQAKVVELNKRFANNAKLKDDNINCQCDHNEEEDDMFQCSFCHTWQHLYCYGYRGLRDSRIPEIHACYECLLQEREQPLFQEMKKLVLLRKTMHLVEKEGYNNEKAFASSLNENLRLGLRMISQLKGKKYIIPTSGSKKKGFALTGKPKFSAVSTEPNFSKMMAEFFNPEAKIAHHFMSPASVNMARDKIEKTVAMQLIPQTAESSNVEMYLQDMQNPNTPRGSMSPNRLMSRDSIDQSSSRNLTAINMKDKLASFRKQSLGKHVHDDKIGGLRTPEPTRKRLRSSKTMEHINVGDDQSLSEERLSQPRAFN